MFLMLCHSGEATFIHVRVVSLEASVDAICAVSIVSMFSLLISVIQ